MDYLIIGFLGGCVGSFLSVLLYRLRTGESAIKGRSKCDYCHKTINWWDNIPLLSYWLLGGKCRWCQKKINLEYWLTEVLVALEFIWIYWLLKVNFDFFGQVEGFYSLALLIYWLILFGGSFAIAIFDFKYMLIPDSILNFLIAAAAGRLLLTQQWQYILVGLATSLGFSILWLITKKKGLGEGDIKLAFLMGLVLGWPQILVALMIAFLTGAAAGVILILFNKKKLKDKIAFGPFLLLGMAIAKLWGWPIWQTYLKWLL